MSVIHDALKTAQREKQSREHAASPAGNPAIVPLRGRVPGRPYDWKNAATIAVASLVIVAALATLWVRMRGESPRVADNIPVVTVPADISPAGPGGSTRPAAVPPPLATAAEATSPAPVPAQAGADVPRTARAPRRADPLVVTRQAATRDDPEEARVPSRSATQPGQLRIEVEPSREGDVARLFAAGVAAHRAGNLTEARSAYEQVLAATPNDVDALNNLGVVLAAMRDLDRGEALLRRAVQLSPEHSGAWNNLGSVLAQRGQSSEAIAAYGRALAIDPQHHGARVSLAQQHLMLGAPARARELLESVVATNPGMAEAHYALGQAAEMEKDWAAAVRAYSAFVRVAPPRLAAVVERVQQRVQTLSARGR